MSEWTQPRVAEARSPILDEASAWRESRWWWDEDAVGKTTAMKDKPRAHPAQRSAPSRVAIVGATGGLGRALAAIYSERGAEVLALARHQEKLHAMQGVAQRIVVDLADPESIAAAVRACGDVDIAVFATGCDVRKSLAAHELADIDALLQTNLRGPILLTRDLLGAVREGGCIAHLGGFGDGRLALPYYSVDVATRAGIAAFCESVTRECNAEGRDIVISYLCPDPTDTEAERPFAKVWAEMGSKTVSVEHTAAFIVDAIARRPWRASMSATTKIATAINALAPAAADAVGLRAASAILRRAFG